MRRCRRAVQATAAVQAVSRSLPTWNIDLGSCQDVGKLCLFVSDGEVLRGLRIAIADEPFAKGSAMNWSEKIAGPIEGRAEIAVSARGRYVRLQAAKLPLDGVDVLLPDPSDELPAHRLKDALSIRSGGWDTTNDQHFSGSEKSLDGVSLNLCYPAGEMFRVTFDLAGSEDGGKVLAWWNGTLIDPRGFKVLPSGRKCSFEIEATGGADQLTFRGVGTTFLPTGIDVTASDAKQASQKWAMQRLADVKAKADATTGTVQGILRRAAPAVTRDQIAAAALSMGLAPFGDEIIFR